MLRSNSGESEYYEESFESDSILHRAPSMEDEIAEEINSIAMLNAKDDGVAKVVPEVDGLDDMVKPATASDTHEEVIEEPQEAEELQSGDYSTDFFDNANADFAALPTTDEAATKHVIFPTPPRSDTSSTTLPHAATQPQSPRLSQAEASRRREIELEQAKQKYQYFCQHSVVAEIEQSISILPRDEIGVMVPKFNDLCSPRGLLTGRSSPRLPPEQLPKIPPKMKFTTAYDEKTGLFGVDLKGERLSKLENYILQRNNRRNNEMFEILVAREHLHRSKPKKYNEGTIVHNKKVAEQLIHREEFNAWTEAMKRVKSTQLDAEKEEYHPFHHARSKSSSSGKKDLKRKKIRVASNSNNNYRSSRENSIKPHPSSNVSFAAPTSQPSPKAKRRGTPLPLIIPEASPAGTPASRSQNTGRRYSSSKQDEEENYESDFEEAPPIAKRQQSEAQVLKPSPPESHPKPKFRRPQPKVKANKPSASKITSAVKSKLPNISPVKPSPTKPKPAVSAIYSAVKKPSRPSAEPPVHRVKRDKATKPRTSLPVIQSAPSAKPKKLLSIKKPVKNNGKAAAKSIATIEDELGIAEQAEIERKIASLKSKIVSGATKTIASNSIPHADSPLLSDASSVFPHLNSVSTIDSLGYTTTYNDTSTLAPSQINKSGSDVGIAMVSIAETSSVVDRYEEDEFESLDSEGARQVNTLPSNYNNINITEPLKSEDTSEIVGSIPVEGTESYEEEGFESLESEGYNETVGSIRVVNTEKCEKGFELPDDTHDAPDAQSGLSKEYNDIFGEVEVHAPVEVPNRNQISQASLKSESYEDSYEEFEANEVKNMVLSDDLETGNCDISDDEEGYSNEFG